MYRVASFLIQLHDKNLFVLPTSDLERKELW